MRVVLETIAEKVDKAINKYHKDILRIELTNDEFEDFIYSESGSKLSYRNIVKCPTEGYSGSHVIYCNVCVQTHHSYTE